MESWMVERAEEELLEASTTSSPSSAPSSSTAREVADLRLLGLGEQRRVPGAALDLSLDSPITIFLQSVISIPQFITDNLKDLQRYLRRDDPQRRDVFKQICKWNTASRDLIPIIEHYQSDRNLVINAVKILVFITMPIDPMSGNIAQQLEYLWDLKTAMTRGVTIAVIVALLEDPLDHLERDDFTEDDWKLVQLVLTLFRNILAIQGISPQRKALGSATRLRCCRSLARRVYSRCYNIQPSCPASYRSSCCKARSCSRICKLKPYESLS